MNVIVELLGGTRATIFAGLLLLTTIALGVQSHRLGNRTEERDQLKAEALVWESAQKTNLDTIDTLEGALAKWEALANSKSAAAAAAARQARADREALAAHLSRRQDERQVIYDRNPDARRWGATRVPADLAEQLQD